MVGPDYMLNIMAFNVNKSIIFALIIEWLVSFVNLALAGTIFLLLKNIWTMYRLPAPVSLVAVVLCICLMVLVVPIPVWLTT